MNNAMRCIATCKLGLESVVASELRALKLEIHAVLDARVYFYADGPALARALLWLRAAERVLMEVDAFEATSFDALFEGVRALDWARVIPRNARVHVNGKSAKSGLFSVPDCQRITKKAIVESLKAAYRTDTIPETGEEVIVEVGLFKDIASITLDACGAGLSRRGYRTWNVAAPISETLGAGILLLSRYRGDRPFLDPMCGSGTLPIEAAMIAGNIAPGLNRTFAAEGWRFLPKDSFSLAREEARDSIVKPCESIMGSDIDERSVALCKLHAKKAGVHCDWAVRPLKELPDMPPGGILAVNPPYGERMMAKDEAAALYGQMRAVFSALEGWGVHIISAYPGFERAYGLRAHKKRKLSNGGKPCVLYQYFPREKLK